MHKSNKTGQWKKETSYDRTKTSIIGGIFMPRSYRHIQEYKKEIMKLRKQGKIKKEICEKYGFSMKQLTNFITRYN